MQRVMVSYETPCFLIIREMTVQNIEIRTDAPKLVIDHVGTSDGAMNPPMNVPRVQHQIGVVAR